MTCDALRTFHSLFNICFIVSLEVQMYPYTVCHMNVQFSVTSWLVVSYRKGLTKLYVSRK
jgi:hypothetical protein